MATVNGRLAAAASTLTGTTLASGIVASSLTSVGTLTSLTSGNITTTGTITGDQATDVVMTFGSASLTIAGASFACGALSPTGAITHTGSTAGFFSVTPATRPTAYTQTYTTATKTHSNPTASSVVTTAAGLASYGYSEAQANALVTAVNALVIDVANVKGVLNSVIDDGQSLGLLQ